jgi:hypothetical protein
VSRLAGDVPPSLPAGVDEQTRHGDPAPEARPGPCGGHGAGAGARVPDFFIVGQPTSGTTALHEMLRPHPQIFMPEGKEPWFFAAELLERTPPRPEGTPRTLAEYLALFEPAAPEQQAGEASALYLWSRTAARAIAEVAPEARIIAILREPASLLRSLHLQFIQTYVEVEPDLRRALELEGARRAGEKLPRHTYWPSTLLYSDHVRYVTQLRRYAEHFPPERMLVLIYDDFRADNEGTVRRVLEFLGVDESHPVQAVEANPSVQMRSARLHEMIHALSVGRGPLSRALKASVKAATPTTLRRSALRATQGRVFSSPEPVDEELMSELRRRFRPEVEALGEYLKTDLIGRWGYDELD